MTKMNSQLKGAKLPLDHEKILYCLHQCKSQTLYECSATIKAKKCPIWASTPAEAKNIYPEGLHNVKLH